MASSSRRPSGTRTAGSIGSTGSTGAAGRAAGGSGGLGLGLALTAAATFATSGTFASSLFAAGWSPAAAVTVRIAIAALVLTPFAAVALRGRWGALLRSAPTVGAYGALAVAACQLCYFNAVERIDVGVALLLEYLAGVLVVGWLWARHGQRPTPLTVAGALTSIAGLALVLGVTGPVRLDALGVAWGLAAAVGCAVFFVVSAQAGGVPPIALAWAGMVVGAVVLAAAGVAGLVPLRVATADVELFGHRASWLVPVLGISLVAAALAYVAGIAGARLLGARLASFVGLAEVLFAVLFAWLFLGQLPGAMQLVGGVVIVAGVALVRLAEPATGVGHEPDPATAPDHELLGNGSR